MKVSLLKQIQDSVIKYANVIASVIKVDVEIVDNSLIRIAGTGIYKDKLNENISRNGFVYRHVLSTGQPQVIEEPGKNSLCTSCDERGCCREKMETCTPIKLSGEIIGVIGLICSSDEQKVRLIENLEFYLQFLAQISEFISAKAYEFLENGRNQSMVKLLNQVINSVDKGVLVINNNSEIVHMNDSAIKQLKLTEAYRTRKIEITPTSEYIMQEETYIINIEGRKINLIGQLIPVFPTLPSYDKILIFSELKKVKSELYSKTHIWQPIKTENIIGESRAMFQLKEKIKKVAGSKSTVLITGESGTGKELIARAIHSESDRKGKPFIAINCGAIPDNLLESELFGYVRGAFSGADTNGRIGKFELANKGVIFLDEIGDMPLHLQVKILRVLQERKIARIGSNQLIDLDIRFVAATNKDLKKLILENKFREDLYYRLNVIPIELPSLRERREDIEIIAANLVEKYNKLFNKEAYCIDKEAIELLKNYGWPGNVRELENTIEFAINLVGNDGVITKDMLPRSILEYRSSSEFEGDRRTVKPLEEIEKKYILKALDIYGNDTKGKQLAAKALGIGIATLYRKLDKIR
ncbi:sigma 54-interacting transcriptional regulator [Clostridium sp. A1-XYC3]|uniref:Sigma 54-interacting transcriptional regulator n=1 Tax=Clostridium tanneri TaxID=3037988 RepID=A0ABU4JU01_9CLOT|nr:sigma 54-interacting transcriptional regulator [Clostridium sp. A1-XYC3]MDW8801618.1 sigma 54-interacting transcriptional regulator [Clostridium sp. A1-XYC3]